MAGRGRQGLGRRVFFSLLPLAIGWLVLEGLALAYFLLAPGRTDPQRPMLYIPSPYRSYRLAPGATDVFGHVSHNSHGFRGGDITEAKPPETIRIVCLGGSTTYNTGATTDSRTYPAQMGRILRDHYANAPFTVEVINAGHPAYTMMETLVLFQTRLLDFAPDVVILHHGLNDSYEAAVFPTFTSDYTHARHTFGPLDVRPWEYSPLLTLLFRKKTSPFNPYAPNRDVDLVALIHNPGGREPDLEPEARARRIAHSVDAFERNALTFIAVARGHDIAPVLSTMAARREDTLYHEILVAWNQRLRALASRESVALVDFAKEMPWNPRAFYDTIHLRDRSDGLERKARIFADVLIDRQILEEVVAKRRLDERTRWTATAP